MKKVVDLEENLFIWVQQGFLKATSFVEWPKELVFGESIYKAIPESADWTDDIFWNSLRNAQSQLVGFEMHIVESDEITKNESFLDTKGVWLHRGVLKLMMLANVKHEQEVIEGFPVLFYQDQQKNLLIGISHWGPWGELAFDLEQESAPVPR